MSCQALEVPLRRTVIVFASSALTFGLFAAPVSPSPAAADWARAPFGHSTLLQAARVFDGHDLRTGVAVLVQDGKIKAVGPDSSLKRGNQRRIDLGDATILPGFIELHAHSAFANIPEDTVLEHGVTTVRDIGGPLFAPRGGKGSLRHLSAGPIMTNPGGYPFSAGLRDPSITAVVILRDRSPPEGP
ncbi:MAG: amidohydrolase family protein [Pseudonocardiaceae bacterium]